jgi:general secretion pathway protein E
MVGMTDQPSNPPPIDSSHRRLGEILIARGLIDEEGLAAALAEQVGCELVDPRVVRLDPDLLARVDPHAAARLGFLPLSLDRRGRVSVLVSDPTDSRLIEAVEKLVEATVEVVVAAPGPLRERIARAWVELAEPTRADEEAIVEGDGEEAEPPPVEGDAPEEQAAETTVEMDEDYDDDADADEPSEADEADGGRPASARSRPIDLAAGGGPSLAELVRSLGRNQGPEAWRELLPALLGNAVQWSADAVRFEGNTKELVVAFRLDGAWRVLLRLPGAVRPDLIASLLTLAGLEADQGLDSLDDRRLATRGGTGSPVVLALETLSMGPACRITVTIRDPSRRFGLDDLGLSPELGRRLRQWTAARQGLLLVVGGSDSGRTTLLRALAARMAGYRPSAMLLHDPVSSPETGWFERGRNDEQGLDALTEALATNPRVLLVDDCDTAGLARAAFATALQDRLVIATLRGRDGAEALQRLRDQGLDDLFLGEQLVGVVETRLVRLLCSSCWARGPLDRALAGRLGLVLDSMPAQVAVAGPGCPLCHHTGYRGRSGLLGRVELVGGVPDGCSPEELRGKVEAGRPRRPAETGLSLVVQNRTSLEELARVLSAASSPMRASQSPARSRDPIATAAEPVAAAPALEPSTTTVPWTDPAPVEPVAAEPEEVTAAPVERPQTDAPHDSAGSDAGAASPHPIVSVASPTWDPGGPEETVAGMARPGDLLDDDEQEEIEGLLDLEEEIGDDRHILVALDPRGEIADRLTRCLPVDEFRVVPARNLSDALDFVRSELPTAIGIPSGWHFDTGGALRAFRDDLASAFLPLLVLAEDKERAVEFLRAGADEVILTGVGDEELELRVRAVIRRVT